MNSCARKFLAAGLSAAVLLTGLASNAAPAQAAAKKFLVDNDKVQCPKATHTTIQAAVADAGSGPATITVCAGTYLGRVQIQNAKRVKLIAKPGVVLQPDFGPFNTPLLDVSNSTSITIQGFTLDGMNSLATSGPAAISFAGTSGVIQKNTILNWHAPTFPTSRAATGIAINGPAGLIVKVSRNNLPGIDRYGISAVGERLLADQNVISALGTSSNQATAVNLQLVSRCSVSRNTVTGDGTVTTGSLIAIWADTVNQCKFIRNTISGAEMAVYMFSIGGGLNKNVVANNLLTENTYGISLTNTSYGTQSSHADNNRITGNKIINTTQGNTGLWILTEGTVGFPATMLHTVVKGNKVVKFLYMYEHQAGANGQLTGVFAPNILIP